MISLDLTEFIEAKGTIKQSIEACQKTIDRASGTLAALLKLPIDYRTDKQAKADTVQNETTRHATGREYREDGTPQILKIEFFPFAGSEWDADSFDHVAIKMDDDCRGLNYMLWVIRQDCTEERIGAAVLEAYDNNRHAPWDAKVGQLRTA